MVGPCDAVLAAFDAGVVVHAPDATILEATDRARALLGIDQHEGRLVPDPRWVLLEQDHSPMPAERLPVAQVVATGAAVRGLAGIVRPPLGDDIHLEINGIPVHDESGRLEQVVVTVGDVTARRRAEALASQAEEEWRQLFDLASVATFLVSNDGRYLRVNPAACELLGRSEDELLTLGFLDVTHPDDVDLGADLVDDLLAGRRSSLRVTQRYVTGSGRVIWVDVMVSAVRAPDGSLRHRIVQTSDITAEHSLRTSLMEAERMARLGHWRLDLATGQVTWSPELFAQFGLDPTGPAPDFAALGALFAPESWERLRTAVQHAQETGTPYELELEFARPDGTRIWSQARGEAVRDARGNIVELHGFSLDITDRKADRDALEELATHDSLTGLANRSALLTELDRALIASRRSDRPTAALMMDLDRFKAINDTLGHAVGDELLVAASVRLEEVVRGGDLVARLGGDEFVVVMRDLADPAEAMRAAGRLVQAFQEPFAVGDRELFATASVGVAISTSASEPGDLLREADTAMYAAKGMGRDRVSMFNEDLRTTVTARLTLEADLRHALERDQLDVWYQPEVDLATGAVIALEALLRWHHPDGTTWTADRFIDVAEETGLIVEIGGWLLRRACRQVADWSAGRPGRPVAIRVNISALQLAEAGLVEAIDEALAASGLHPGLLCLEIDETALVNRTTATSANLAAIHERGISLSLDDFGTGYASLTYLDQYPIDVIRMDRSFIAGSDERRHRLVAGIIALARSLDIGVTAEGVEHSRQASRLHELGCPSAQGWLYSAAVPAADVPGMLGFIYPHP